MVVSILLGTMLVLGACGGDDDSNKDAANNNDNATEESANDNNNESTNENGGGTVDTAAAEEVYKSNCASCHGGDLSGNMGPGLKSIGNDYSADEIADIIKNGTDGGMPADVVSGDDVDLLANWLAEMK